MRKWTPRIVWTHKPEALLRLARLAVTAQVKHKSIQKQSVLHINHALSILSNRPR